MTNYIVIDEFGNAHRLQDLTPPVLAAFRQGVLIQVIQINNMVQLNADSLTWDALPEFEVDNT